MTWLIFALLTALFTSLQDIFGKKVIHKVDVTVAAWAWQFFSLPFLYPVLIIKGIPVIKPPFWYALAVSTFILIFASLYYFKAIKISDISLSMPMLAFTPLLLLISSPIILGEFPKPLGLIGISFIVIGSYILNIKEKRKGFLEPFKSLLKAPGTRYMLYVALLFSIGANMDKIGVLSASPVMWITALNTSLMIILTIVMLFNSKNILQQIRGGWVFLVLVGLANAIALIFQMEAIRLTLVPYLIAVKRTSVIMTVLFGFLLFKEKGFQERFWGVVVMVFGVVLISFS